MGNINKLVEFRGREGLPKFSDKDGSFWLQRSEEDPKRIFSDPFVLLQECYAYFEWRKNHPWYRYEQRKQPVKPIIDDLTGAIIIPDDLVKIPIESPLQLLELCMFLGVSSNFFLDFKRDMIKQKDKKGLDMARVIAHVEDVIRAHKMTGASVGAFNANIIAQDLGLDKTPQEGNVFETIVHVIDNDTKRDIDDLIGGDY